MFSLNNNQPTNNLNYTNIYSQESSRKKESDTKSPGKKEDEKRHRSSKSKKEKDDVKSTKDKYVFLFSDYRKQKKYLET